MARCAGVDNGQIADLQILNVLNFPCVDQSCLILLSKTATCVFGMRFNQFGSIPAN